MEGEQARSKANSHNTLETEDEISERNHGMRVKLGALAEDSLKHSQCQPKPLISFRPQPKNDRPSVTNDTITSMKIMHSAGCKIKKQREQMSTTHQKSKPKAPADAQNNTRNVQVNKLMHGNSDCLPTNTSSQGLTASAHLETTTLNTASISQPTLQAAASLFCFAQSQFQKSDISTSVRVSQSSPIEMVSNKKTCGPQSGEEKRRILFTSASIPCWDQILLSMRSASANVGTSTPIPSICHPHEPRYLINSSQVVDRMMLAMKYSDVLMAHQIRQTAGLPLDLVLLQTVLNSLHGLNQHPHLPLAAPLISLQSTTTENPPQRAAPIPPPAPCQSFISLSSIQPRIAGDDHRLSLYISSDDDVLAENQIAIRQNIELFEATQADVDTSVSGRRKPLVVGQVGIQCIHCSQVPIKQRKKGARYYPARLDGIYQASQNMAYCHLAQSCEHIDDNAKRKLLSFQRSRSNGHGGKKYWSQTARAQGVTETDRFGLKFG